MEETDRQKLQSHRVDILERISTDINGFVDNLYAQRVIGEAMKDKVDGSPQAEKARVFLDNLARCGPAAYKSFIAVMWQKDIKDLVKQMEPDFSDGASASGAYGIGSDGVGREKTDMVTNSDIFSQLGVLTKELIEMKKENKNEMGSLKKENMEMRQENWKMRQDILTYNESLEHLHQKIDDFTPLKEENDRLRDKQKKIRYRISDLEARLKQANLEKETLKRENKTLLDQLKKANKAVEEEKRNGKQEKKSLQEKVEKTRELENRTKQMEEKIKLKDYEIANMQETLSKIQESVKQLEESLTKVNRPAEQCIKQEDSRKDTKQMFNKNMTSPITFNTKYGYKPNANKSKK